MIEQNSGKIYRFKLDHGLGYGFAEVYDFTDESRFNGRPVFVFNRVDTDLHKKYEIEEVRSSGIALGPLAFYRFPNVRGVGAWKFLFRCEDFLITERPPYKVLYGMEAALNNWAEFTHWTHSSGDLNNLVYVPYEEVRYLETRILNSTLSAVDKLSMKLLLDRGEKVADYYDLRQLGNRNSFCQLINTYYPLEKTLEFVKQIPANIIA